MGPILSKLGTVVLGEIIKKIMTKALAWAEDRPEPEPDIIELKLSQIAARVLPASIPEAKRDAVVTSLVEIVLPTFEQVVEFSPTTQKIMETIRRPGTTVTNYGRGHSGVWHHKTAAKKSVAKKAPAGSYVTVHRARKSAPIKHSVKKSAGQKVAAKKVVAKKAPAKKMAKKAVRRR